jgi:alpha-beta hydrolase superfamily lysophospholipase
MINAWQGRVVAHGELLDHRPLELADQLAATSGDAKLIRYLSTALHGGPTVVSGVVLIPTGDPPANGWPVVAWGAGGFGVSDRTAPSRSPFLSSRAGNNAYAPFLSRLLDAGYAVAATDYEGQGTPGVRPFQAPYSEGRSMIDAVLAARQLQLGLDERWFAVGHSGGGHAALDAAETSDLGYAGRLRLLGCVVMEPAGDFQWVPDEVEQLMAGPEGTTFRAIYAALVVGLKAQHPELRLSDYLGSRALARIEVTYCETQGDASAAYADLPGDEFAPRSAAAADRMRAWLAANAVPRRSTRVPIFLPTGERQHRRPMVKRSLDRTRELGGTVLLRLYPDVDHRQLLSACQDDVLNWLRDRLDGLPAPSN